MDLPFRLFLQEYSNGIVTAQVLATPDLSAQATDRATAIENARRMLVSYIADTSRLAAPPADLVFHEQQELRSLSVDLRPKGKLQPDPIPITVCLVVAVEQHPRGVRCIVTAPRIPGFQLVVEDAEQIEEKTRAALAHHTRKWRSPAILDADQRAAPSLETIHVPVPEPGARHRPGSGLLDDSDDEDESVLRTCGINLTAQVATNGLSRADRRDELVEQILATLAGSTASSVLLVGQEGVGKTALVHEIVARIHAGTVPERLRGRDCWAVTGNNLIAGMSYIGQWQRRVQSLIQEVRKGRQILHMGDPNAILDAGRWSGSDNNMGQVLRPYVESGDIIIICECTPEGLAAALKTQPGFVHAFRRVDVPAAHESETHAILQAEARRLEAAHNLSIAPEATAAVVELTRRFMPYRAFPGKAVSLLRSAIRETLPEPGHAPVPRTLGRADVVAGFTRATGLPSLLLSDAEPLDEGAVRAYFEERLLGQSDAVMAMVELILLIKAGLTAPNKPLGSFFFVGPTGVGKTEMAKVLASYLFGGEDRLVRFDMSEYGTTDALPKLIGSAWQRETEGELTRRVREQPFCVVLLDELEKAHADVYDALLQVLGEGRLTDASGRTADFRNTIIIMTSNLGASRRETQALGFGAAMPEEATDERLRAHFRKEAESFFRPEFFNRIDRIVVFRSLTLEAMRRITRRELGKLLMREGITRRNLVVEPFDEAVIETLLERGFHPHYGARPLQREIERMVSLPLARAVVGEFTPQHHVLRFSVRQGKIHLTLVPIETPEEALGDGDAVTVERPGKRSSAPDLALTLAALRALREQSGSEEAGPVVQRLRHEVSGLLRRTRQPSFWDEPVEAKEVLSRVYHLERVLKRLDAVAERADYLIERGRQIRAHRDQRGHAPLAADATRLEAEFAYVQLELAGAATAERRDQALVRVVPLASESAAWAAELLDMYRAWAVRKGYDWNHYELGSPGTAAGDAPPLALYLQGSNVYAFLRGEAGIHRLDSGAGEARERFLARVAILMAPPPRDDPAEMRAALQSAITRPVDSAALDDPDGVVRIYSRGRHRLVRDTRTGLRLTDVEVVLEGDIDAFVLARLRHAAETSTT